MSLLSPRSDTPSSAQLNFPRLRSAALAAAAAATMIVTLLSAAPVAAAEAPLPPPNGLTAQSAAASCWEIKQVTPSAPSGIYWLVTPQLGAPERFYCDQTTDGGGWVLIGRGREDWSISNEGMGTPAEVRDVITGQAAFAPRQLSSKMIEGLLNGSAVQSLDDGVRLRRASNSTGTTWQEVTFKFSSPRSGWSWMFDNEQRVGAWRFGILSGSGGTTNSFGSGTLQTRVQTMAGEAQGWVYGFGYGSSSRGDPSASTYIWAPTTTSPNPRPFTQMFLRPKLLSSTTFSDIPASGTAKKEGIAVHESFAQRTTWGVAGLGAGPSSLEGSNEVSAFAEGNGVVYVGGNFTTVQQSSGGAGQVSQAYLAAFDVDTGAWISSFRPTLNNQVKALAVLPDGRVAAGGYFTTVNGQPREGLVVLNGATGATDTQFTGRLINRLSGGLPIVRALDVQDGWLYAAGTFTHGTGGSLGGGERYTRSAARFSVTNGTPDAWNPEFNGTVIAADASARGDRAFFSGYFTQSAGRAAMKVAALSTASIELYPWVVDFANATSNYQQTIKEAGNRVWIGGSQHMFFSYDRNTLAELSTNITKAGGDLQAAASNGVAVYGGCHCFHTVYVGADKWSNVGTSWTAAERINSIGAWNAATGAHLPGFSPLLSARNGAGAWALFVDSTGVLWAGGDYTASVRAGFTRQWSGGYIRFGVADHVAPSRPSALGVTETATGVRVAWSGSTDDRGPVTYQVLRKDRVVATTTGLSVELPSAPNGTNYFVRAADAAGNWSASTPAAQLSNTQPPPSTGTFIPAGSTWKYWYNAAAPTAGWTGTGYNDSTWATGAAPIGYGHSSLGTTLPTLDPKPITSYYRKAITIPDAGALANIKLTTRADDGIIVYVNGYEVLRRNLDSGATITHNYYANASPSASTALANPVSVVVPGSAFVSGTNVITAEVHSGYRSTPSHSFELTAEGTSETATVPPPGPVTPQDPPDDPQDPPDDPPAGPLVAAASNWNYWYSADAPAAGWAGVSFDASGWASGPAPIGYGHSTLGTTLPVLDPRPITSYYRHAFTVADVGQLTTVTLTTRADDGIIVYVNGVEVVRQNLDPGTITHNYYANASPSASTALANPVTVQVPASAFRNGANVISAEVHSGYRTTPSHSFELTATTG